MLLIHLIIDGAEKQMIATNAVNQIPFLNPDLADSSPTTQAPIQQIIKAMIAIGAAISSKPETTLSFRKFEILSKGFI